MFLVLIFGQSVAGYRTENQDLRDHKQPEISYSVYVSSGTFAEKVFENWESEFLQMGWYILLTVWLFQKGSAESKDPDAGEAVDEDPKKKANDLNAPWPVRREGVVRALYSHSLSIAFILMFLLSFAGHAIGGTSDFNEEQRMHGGESVSVAEFVRTSQFWDQSLQNWQSEFLAVFAIVVLSIFLREKGSPESKPVAAPHSETG